MARERAGVAEREARAKAEAAEEDQVDDSGGKGDQVEAKAKNARLEVGSKAAKNKFRNIKMKHEF